MRGGTLIRVIAALVPAVVLAGCGCSWGTISDVAVTPEYPCLVATVAAGCAETGTLTVENGCTDPLTLTAQGGGADVVVQPAASGSATVDGYATEGDAGDCKVRFIFQGTLGADPVELSFTREKVNRGAFGC